MSQETKTYIDHFSSQFHSLLKSVIQIGHPVELLETLVKKSDDLGQFFIHPGSKAFHLITRNERSETPETLNNLLIQFIITYSYSDTLKIFMILWRDSIFQLQKARLLALDEGNESILYELSKDIQAVINDAGEELLGILQSHLKNATEYPNQYKKNLKKWQLEKNPWPTYEKQIKEIANQCKTLQTKYLIILKSAQSFQRIKSKILETINTCQNELQEVRGFIDRTTSVIQDEAQSSSEKSLTHIANKLQSIGSQILLTYHIDVFNAQLEKELINIAGDTEFTIQIQNGMLLQNRINFLKRLSLWINREILPLLFEAWEITELNKNGLKMALQNIRNMAALSSPETPDKKPQSFNEHTFLQPLNVLIENNTEASRQLKEFSELIAERIDYDFKLSLIYDTTRYFLPFSSGSTITTKLNLGKIKLLKVSHSWINSQKIRLLLLRKKMVHEFSLSRLEKMVRFLRIRQRDETNGQYTSFFVTKGYFGDLFTVGRDEELAHFSMLINNWREGYRGSVIVTGQRFSGKTLTGELVASRNFPDSTFRLSPGMTLSLNGRKMESSYNILESLEFLAKYRQDSKSLIWIDDIELWWEPNMPLQYNIRNLLNFIDHNSGNFFFMVSMNLSTFHHLKQVIDLERIFQAHIHLGKLSSNEIEKAILIRHMATHRTLVNHKLEKVGQAEFRRIIKQISQVSKGNIGDALNLWSYFVNKADDEQVTFESIPSFGVPEFYRPELAVLLTSIMLQKRTNEHRLRKLFGPAFTEKYQPVLLRMISIGLIERQLDGWLEINERVVNEMGNMLSAKHYLTY